MHQRRQRRDRVLRLLGHQLDSGKQLPFARALRLERDRALKDADRGIRLLQPHEAGGLSVQRVELRIDQRTRLLEVSDRRLAVAVPVLQHGEHRVRSRIVGTQSQDPIQQRHGARGCRLRSEVERRPRGRRVVRVDLQRALERLQRLGPFAHARERDALAASRAADRSASAAVPIGCARRLREVPGAQRRRDRIDSRALLSERGLARRRQQRRWRAEAGHACRGASWLNLLHG